MRYLLVLNFFGLSSDRLDEVYTAKTNLYEEIFFLRKQQLLTYEEIMHMHTSQRQWWINREIKYLNDTKPKKK